MQLILGVLGSPGLCGHTHAVLSNVLRPNDVSAPGLGKGLAEPLSSRTEPKIVPDHPDIGLIRHTPELAERNPKRSTSPNQQSNSLEKLIRQNGGSILPKAAQ